MQPQNEKEIIICIVTFVICIIIFFQIDNSNTDVKLKKHMSISTTLYSWPLNNTGINGTNSQRSKISTNNLWFPQNLIINSLSVTRSLTHNIVN